MEKFELTTYQPEQPNWFKRLAKAGRVLVHIQDCSCLPVDTRWNIHRLRRRHDRKSWCLLCAGLKWPVFNFRVLMGNYPITKLKRKIGTIS